MSIVLQTREEQNSALELNLSKVQGGVVSNFIPKLNQLYPQIKTTASPDYIGDRWQKKYWRNRQSINKFRRSRYFCFKILGIIDVRFYPVKF